MSDKRAPRRSLDDWMKLVTECRQNGLTDAAMQEIQNEGFTEKEYGMVRLENVGDVLFQALLVDDIKAEYDKIYVELYTIGILS